MNINFGKLVNGAIEYAPDYIDTELGRINHPTETNYKFYGWKKIIRDSDTILGWYEVGSTIRSINPNSDFGKLVNGAIEYAPDVMLIGGNYVEPTESQYAEAGYKKIFDSVNENIISKIIERDYIYIIRHTNDYAKLVEGELIYAENMIVTDDSVNISPSAEDYLAIEYKKFTYKPYPETVEGYDWEPDRYEETETEISNKYKLVPIPVPEPEPRIFSKMNLELAIFNSGIPGLLTKVDAFIDSVEIENVYGDKMSLRRLYDKALTFAESNPYFSQYLTAIKEAIPELTDEVVESILSASVAR